ncbi:RNA-binding Raly-like protein [Scleropages formosus]|uniref:RNA-binding Raly-like protein n=1 Tax=Scleropages formosus TaxID=113540 RepID=A0A8C9U0H9_SCLFO|nr:RNA-binding Raly-like protein [Scleropages formosus]
MTLFKSEHRSPRYISMTGDLKSSRPRTASKRPGSAMYRSDYDLDHDCYQDNFYDRVYDYQRVPASVPPMVHPPSLSKRPRSSSSTRPLSRDRLPSKSSSRTSSSSSRRARLRMEELQTIKRELKMIKVQIDGLLDSLDRMDRQRRHHTGSPPAWGGSLASSPHNTLASSSEGSPSPQSSRSRAHRDGDAESPEPGEASDDEQQAMNHHSSDLEDDM